MSSSSSSSPPDNTSWGDVPVFYKTVENPALPLLLTCHQLHDETHDVVRRWQRTQRPASYTADVMFVDDVGLWTTWLSVPVRTARVDTLYADFRLFGPPRDLDLARGGGGVGHDSKRDVWDDGGDDMMALATDTPSNSTTAGGGAWGFYDLLNGLLEGEIGPWPTTRQRQQQQEQEQEHRGDVHKHKQPLHVRRLVLNITSTSTSASDEDVLSLSEIARWASASQLPPTFLPPPPPQSQSPPSSSSSCTHNHSPSEDVSGDDPTSSSNNQKLAATTFARLIHLLLTLLQSPTHSRAHGTTLLHRVGAVEVQVDGARYGPAVDLSRSLVDDDDDEEDAEEEGGAGGSSSPFREEWRAELLEWRASTAERRRLAGFGTVEMVVA